MILFPNCKINLGLSILRKRADGYHDLETVFYPIPLHDALEINPRRTNHSNIPEQQLPELTVTGLSVAGEANDNLCVKAWQLLKADYPNLPAVNIHLHKAIPMGAGLGGGSADGAYTLLLLNKQFKLNLTRDQLLHYALQLGSDCPFFIYNQPCLGLGRGEILQPVTVDLSAYKIIIVNPRIHINTGWAFHQLTPAEPEHRIADIIAQPIDTWKKYLINDFEEPVLQNHPELREIKDKFYESGAIYAAMSGSGSSFFGIFECNNALNFTFPDRYFFKELQKT
ncbi:4-(cytidine 5'-diphospho)-2-C-methyl-D-erythritol kinase [Filimonas effusa]|uniref:4-diphosphocytidyl-2-C-methyl-D-erythritol kinase n=1 Tax=Filimonas effusa TaxID=2508721 RepID=A0A4Q1DCD3_9BACT|nr:4-(cytidine 5'-diphospho)-2-C-methyl-D-erythritol kinase [Filimonas effusa]RXK87174.1 4-(cytidine 5'-diphospho)-2-C-methyl-D-erythritol kinase [Filimonas effusa]